MLLFLLFCKGERSVGLLEKVLRHPESMDNLFVSLKEFESPHQDSKDDPRTLKHRKPNDLDFKDDIARQADIHRHPESAARPLIPKHSPEVGLNLEKRSNLTNGEVEGVINAHSLVPSSEEEYALQPELHLETGVGDALPERTRGRSKWVTESEDGLSGPRSRSRRRRSWLWNQFFVIEEYRGPEPVLIGRVSCCHDQSACE